MITCIYGAPRSGKSTLARSIIAQRERVIILDPTLEMPCETWVDSFDAARAIDWSGPFSVQWTCEPWWEFFYSLDNVLIVLDEADTYWPRGIIPEPLSAIFTRGGHWGIDTLVISQRPKLTPPRVRSLALEVYSFQLYAEEERKYLRASWGIVPPSERFRYVFFRASGGPASTSEGGGAERAGAPRAPPGASKKEGACDVPAKRRGPLRHRKHRPGG